MKTPLRGRRIALLSGAVTLAILVSAGIASRDWIVEEYFIRMLDSIEEEKRALAVRKLGELRCARSVPSLARLLDRGTSAGLPASRFATERVFKDGIFGSPFIREAMRVWYEDVHPATAALIRIGPPSIPALLELLRSEKGPVVLQACHALGELGSAASEAIPLLEAIEKRGSPFDVVASEALGKIRLDSWPAIPADNAEEDATR